ncbi:MAG: hemin uptake protein HemP [Phycisphaerae bacterium]|nr:hemin uptake protein HemP [Phycisphaerae bacterium]
MNRSDEEPCTLPAEASAPRRVDSTKPIVVDSRTLFRGRQEIQIRHEDEIYRLRVTRNGRLILNK